MVTKIAIGADHRGFDLKQRLINNKFLANKEIDWIDVGADNNIRSDYPEFAISVAKLVQEKTVNYGVLLCGTGVGMAIAANRFKYVYAGLAWNETIAKLNKEDDNVNILALPADYIDLDQAQKIITAWLLAEFKSGRYQSRIKLIDTIC